VTDYETAYRELRLRVTDLMQDRPDEVVEHVVPATPAWRVRDVAAHLGGVCDDIAHGNLDGVATDAWTQAQVDKRRDWPFEQVLADWSEHASVVEPMMNGIGTPIGQMVFDAWTHEQDVRGALHEPGAREGAALDLAWEWFVQTHESVGAPEGGSIRVVSDVGEALLGSGEPVATVSASRYELLRAITGRRSRAQVRALDVDGADLDGVLFVSDFFRPAGSDIVE
jgi:uncharacterized protein (TIGR03083 family)